MIQQWWKRRIENPALSVTGLSVVIVCVVLIISNHKQENFFNADLIDIVTILLGSVITFLISEKNNRNVKRKECIERVIDFIEASVLDDMIFQPSDEALFKQYNCANRIKYLEKANFVETRNDIVFIRERFQILRELYSNHSHDPEELKKAKIDFDKYRRQIIDKCTKIRIELYK